MADKGAEVREAGTGAVLKEVVGDFEVLLEQQVRLLKSEVGQELRKARDAALALGAGGGLLAAGGVLSTFMLVHLLHRSTRLPLWACYGAVAGLLGAAGTGLLTAGGRRAAAVQLTELPQTVGALKENLTWIKDQVTSRPA